MGLHGARDVGTLRAMDTSGDKSGKLLAMHARSVRLSDCESVTPSLTHTTMAESRLSRY